MSFLRCHPSDSPSMLEFGNTFNKGEEFPVGTEARSLGLRRFPSCLHLCHVLDLTTFLTFEKENSLFTLLYGK